MKLTALILAIILAPIPVILASAFPDGRYLSYGIGLGYGLMIFIALPTHALLQKIRRTDWHHYAVPTLAVVVVFVLALIVINARYFDVPSPRDALDTSGDQFGNGAGDLRLSVFIYPGFAYFIDNFLDDSDLAVLAEPSVFVSVAGVMGWRLSARACRRSHRSCAS